MIKIEFKFLISESLQMKLLTCKQWRKNFSIDSIIAQIASSDSQKRQLQSYFVK